MNLAVAYAGYRVHAGDGQGPTRTGTPKRNPQMSKQYKLQTLGQGREGRGLIPGVHVATLMDQRRYDEPSTTEHSRLLREWEIDTRGPESLFSDPSELQDAAQCSSAGAGRRLSTVVRKVVQHLDTKTGSAQHECYDWLPATLRLPWLATLFVFSLALGVVTVVITVYSKHNSGLGSDNGSASIFFGWRFSPTLLVVTYNILVTTLLQDIRRTEIFARLAAVTQPPLQRLIAGPSAAGGMTPSML